jgi:hypothetical protein
MSHFLLRTGFAIQQQRFSWRGKGQGKPGLVMFIICRMRTLLSNSVSLISHFIILTDTNSVKINLKGRGPDRNLDSIIPWCDTV